MFQSYCKRTKSYRYMDKMSGRLLTKHTVADAFKVCSIMILWSHEKNWAIVYYILDLDYSSSERFWIISDL